MSESMEYTRFERARIIGARALQIAMGAPVLLDVPDLTNPVRVAIQEFDAGLVPITVHRRTPERAEYGGAAS